MEHVKIELVHPPTKLRGHTISEGLNIEISQRDVSDVTMKSLLSAKVCRICSGWVEV